jgi:hypothetical protein
VFITGGLTESLVKASSSAFVDYLTEHEEELQSVCDGLITVLLTDKKNDRVVVPLFKTVRVSRSYLIRHLFISVLLENLFLVKYCHENHEGISMKFTDSNIYSIIGGTNAD